MIEYIDVVILWGLLFNFFVILSLIEIMKNQGVSLRRYIETHQYYFLVLFFGVLISMIKMLK